MRGFKPRIREGGGVHCRLLFIQSVVVKLHHECAMFTAW